MTIFFSKLLPLFLYPTGVVTILVLLALLFWKRRRLSFVFLLAGFLVLLIAGNRYVAQSFARSLEWKYPPLTARTTADAIVLLGGGTEPASDPRPMVEVNAAGDRVLYTLKLYQEHAAPKIIVSGGDIDFLDESPSTPADDMSVLLQMMGVPEEDILLQNQSQNTEEDARYVCEIIKEQGFQKVILVTSAFHMPRSVALFEGQGCPAIPAPVDFSITKAGWERLEHPTVEEFLLNLLPSYTHLSTVTKTMKEYFGMWYYRLSGVL